MMKNVFGAIFLLVVCCAAYAEQAAEQPKAASVSAEGVTSINDDMQAAEPIMVGSLIEDAFEKFRKERGIEAYGSPNANGTVYFTGKSYVVSNVKSANFIKSRSMAYERAKTDAIAKMIMDLVGEETTVTLRKYLSDESDNRMVPPENEKDADGNIVRKFMALAETKLDEGLRDMGVDPSKYEGKVNEKKVIFRDMVYKKSLRRAFYKASGFLPVQTFEARTPDGRYCIGVVIRTDADCTEIARSLYFKRIPMITRANGLSIQEALPNDKELLAQFGVRLYFDEEGLPSLLSFGSWGSSYTGKNERRMERSMDHAFEQAESLANENLTEFINSTLSILEQSEKSEEEIESIPFEQDGSIDEAEFSEIIDRIMKESKQVGRDSLKGRSTVLKKTLSHPSGHKIACVVRRWSFAQLRAADWILKGKKPDAPGSGASSVKAGDQGVRKGRVYDF